MGRSSPTPLFFVSAHSKGVAGESFVSADSKRVISPLFSALRRGLGSEDSKGFIGEFCL